MTKIYFIKNKKKHITLINLNFLSLELDFSFFLEGGGGEEDELSD